MPFTSCCFNGLVRVTDTQNGCAAAHMIDFLQKRSHQIVSPYAVLPQSCVILDCRRAVRSVPPPRFETPPDSLGHREGWARGVGEKEGNGERAAGVRVRCHEAGFTCRCSFPAGQSLSPTCVTHKRREELVSSCKREEKS